MFIWAYDPLQPGRVYDSKEFVVTGPCHDFKFMVLREATVREYADYWREQDGDEYLGPVESIPPHFYQISVD
jgi:hypothetical protein